MKNLLKLLLKFCQNKKILMFLTRSTPYLDLVEWVGAIFTLGTLFLMSLKDAGLILMKYMNKPTKRFIKRQILSRLKIIFRLGNIVVMYKLGINKYYIPKLYKFLKKFFKK